MTPDRSYLALDIGNTSVKAIYAPAAGPETVYAPLSEVELTAVPSHGLSVGVCQTGSAPSWLEKWLAAQTQTVFTVSAQAALPFSVEYETPHTLGADRLANIAGALEIWGPGPLLVLSLGTALTTDVLNNQNQYIGGSISPGWKMRLAALHHFTARLPDLTATPHPTAPPPGASTSASIQSGVYFGLLAELQYWIDTYRQRFGDALRTVLTGGDAPEFENQLKNLNFATPHLALWGTLRLMRHQTQ